MLRKIINSSFLLTVMLLCFGSVVFANEESSYDRFSIEDGFVIDNETNYKYGNAYRYNENGERVEVDLEELKVLLENEAQSENQLDSTINLNEIGHDNEIDQIIVYNYIESSRQKAVGPSMAVSNWVSCPSGGSECKISSTTGWSVRERFSSNVVSNAFNAIRVGASFTWEKSITRSVTYELPVQPGRRGRMMFMPEYNRTYGKLYNNAGLPTLDVHGDSPIINQYTGEPEGTFYILYSN